MINLLKILYSIGFKNFYILFHFILLKKLFFLTLHSVDWNSISDLFAFDFQFL